MRTERIFGRRSHVEFVNIFDEESLRSPSGAIQILQNWALEYLCEPHEDLGRAGPVCPFTGPSVHRRLFWAGVVSGDDIDFESMSDVVEDMADIYPQLPPCDGKDEIFKAIIAVFPDVNDFDLIDTVQFHGKSTFVNTGMMLGQFYPGCLQSGLWNDDFRALDAPLPMLAVRQMVSTDYPFLTGRAEWMSAYLKRFAPTVPPTARAFIVAKMEA